MTPRYFTTGSFIFSLVACEAYNREDYARALDASVSDSTIDAPADVSPDALRDTSSDSFSLPSDVSSDALSDALLDAALDSTPKDVLDAAADVGVVMDTAVDAGTDTGVDTGVDTGAPRPGWWNAAWTKRQRLTFNNAAGFESLVNVPVLVTLNGQRFDRTAARSDGGDLRFVDADGTTLLPHEIEAWDVGDVAYIWVRVPQIDPGSSTDSIWLYYGNADAPAPERGTAVWSSGYAGVWHLGTDVADSTANQNNFADSSTMLAPGIIASARSFNASNSAYLRVLNSPSLGNLSDRLTVSAWARRKSTDSSAYRTILSRRARSVAAYDIWLGFHGNEYRGELREPTKSSATSIEQGIAPVGTWTYLTLVYDGTSAQLFVDGVLQGTAIVGSSLATNNYPIFFGAESSGSGMVPDKGFLNADLDEVRIEQVARSAEWIRAQYDSMRDALITYGPVEQ